MEFSVGTGWKASSRDFPDAFSACILSRSCGSQRVFILPCFSQSLLAPLVAILGVDYHQAPIKRVGNAVKRNSLVDRYSLLSYQVFDVSLPVKSSQTGQPKDGTHLGLLALRLAR